MANKYIAHSVSDLEFYAPVIHYLSKDNVAAGVSQFNPVAAEPSYIAALGNLAKRLVELVRSNEQDLEKEYHKYALSLQEAEIMKLPVFLMPVQIPTERLKRDRKRTV